MDAIYTLADAGIKDRSLIEQYGLSSSLLIDSAARGAYGIIRSRLKGRIAVMAGPGNNGCDGLELASIMASDGYDVSVILPYENGNKENLERREHLPLSVERVSSPSGYDIVIDALFGFSYHAGSDGIIRELDSEIDDGALRIAMDVPSGGIIRADITVSFMVPKLELYLPSLRGIAGEIHIFNPGFPQDELTASPSGTYLISDDDSRIHRIGISDFKNSRGHIAIIGGSDEYTGAPRLAGRAAFFSGCGLVTVITSSEKIRDDNPSFMIRKPDADLSRYDALLVGPGWGSGDPALLDSAIASGKNMVLDADGLKFAAGHDFCQRAVLTPHIGEYRRLMASLGIDDGLSSAESLASSLRNLAKTLSAVLVLKSSTVWITSGDDIDIYDGANPSRGVAGSGDVLSGIIASLLAGGEDPMQAAIDGVILHQKAGRRAHADYGFYSADELILSVGRVR